MAARPPEPRDPGLGAPNMGAWMSLVPSQVLTAASRGPQESVRGGCQPLRLDLAGEAVDDQADEGQAEGRVGDVDALKIFRRDASKLAIRLGVHGRGSQVCPAEHTHLSDNAA